MPEILYRATKKLDASIANNTWVEGVGLDLDMPWNHCWSLLLTPEVKVWWTENFKDHTTLIITGARTISQFLSGDAKISGHASGHLPSAGGDAPHDGNAGGKRAKINEQNKPGTEKVKAKDMLPCKGFNSGNCSGEPGKVCPRNDHVIHKCSKCNSGKHSVFVRPQLTQKKAKAENSQSVAPWIKKPRGKGGGKKGRDGW